MGCTRPENSVSKIKIQAPRLSELKSKVGALAALPTDKKICFGVNVTGNGIPTTPGVTCKGLGNYGGFVNEGQVISLDVLKGNARNFDLLIYLADLGTSCPNLGPEMGSSAHLARLIISGNATAEISAAESYVEIPLSFPGSDQNLAINHCNGPASLKAKLLSNGDLLDPNELVLASSSPVLEGAFSSPIADTFNIGLITTGGVLNLASDNLKVPDSIYSMTRKPDTGLFYGLQYDGVIVELLHSGGSLAVVSVPPANCPFNAPNCQVPVWFQSVSAGYGKELYGLDHSGALYSLGTAGPDPLGVSYGDQVSQVSFY